MQSNILTSHPEHEVTVKSCRVNNVYGFEHSFTNHNQGQELSILFLFLNKPAETFKSLWLNGCLVKVISASDPVVIGWCTLIISTVLWPWEIPIQPTDPKQLYPGICIKSLHRN